MLSEDRPAIDSPVSLTSEPDRFSDEAWELLLAGQDLARRWRHGELDVEHLMQVLFSDRRFAGSLRDPDPNRVWQLAEQTRVLMSLQKE